MVVSSHPTAEGRVWGRGYGVTGFLDVSGTYTAKLTNKALLVCPDDSRHLLPSFCPEENFSRYYNQYEGRTPLESRQRLKRGRVWGILGPVTLCSAARFDTHKLNGRARPPEAKTGVPQRADALTAERRISRISTRKSPPR